MALVDEVNEAVLHLSLAPEDGAAVALARQYAEAIDAACDSGDAQTMTKALYLGPHLLRTLGDLGATPAGRAAMAAKVPAVPPAEKHEAKSGTVSQLSDMRKRVKA